MGVFGPASRPDALVNLSEIDFTALQAKFAHGHQRPRPRSSRR
jgi:type I restriction enzyme R subunit